MRGRIRFAVVLAACLPLFLLGGCRRQHDDAVWTEKIGPPPTGTAAAGAPDVLVVLIDALRPDHLGCYGYVRPTSPFLDRWSRDATRFDGAFTAATHTRMSIASLFTGTRPTVHRVRRVDLETEESASPSGMTDALSEKFTTLAESLSRAGYETWGFSANPHISTELGFDQGFTRWWQTRNRKGRVIADAFARQLAARRALAPGRPLFVYLHLMSVHNPYAPPSPWNRTFADGAEGKVVYTNGPAHVGDNDLRATIAQYDGAIRYTDSLLEELLPAWEKGSGAGRPTATIVLSDHGEEFLDHGGLGHGMTVFRELARITLLVNMAGLPKGVFTAPVSTLDLHRMLLDAAGAPAPSESQGRPAAEWTAPERIDPVLYTESRTGWAAYRWETRTLLFPIAHPERAVWYEERSDPREMRPREESDAIAALEARLAPHLAADARLAAWLGTPTRLALGEEARGALKSLGYLGGL